MRSKLIFLFFILFFNSQAQQKYISSAIIAFTGGAFERTIRDINIALESKDLLSEEEITKAHFYRGMATSRLLLTNTASADLPKNPYLSAFQDLTKARQTDADKYGARATDELKNLATGLANLAEQNYRQGKATTSKSKVAILGRAIVYLQALETIQSDVALWLLFGNTYYELGLAYTAQGSDRANANFRAATRYYELGLKQSSDCSVCLTGLIDAASQLGEDARVAQYRQLQDSATN